MDQQHQDHGSERTSPPDEDWKLIALVRRGDEQAFRRLVEKHHPKVFSIARGIVGDWHQSEDVCQEVFTAFHRHLSAFRGDSSLGTWLYRVAVNAALKERRRSRRRGFEDVDAVEATAAPSAGGTPREPGFEGQEVFRKLLAPLPDKLRAVVILREEGGLTYEEIASVLGTSRGAVEQKLHRAMVQLREIWKDREKWIL